MATKLRLGLVGAGRQGAVHARIIARAVPDARLVAIADVNLSAAQRLAEEVDVPIVYDNPADLAAAPEVDAVVIVASSRHHLEVVEAVAAAGKDMLCEKPLALTLEETERAITAAERAGVRLQVGFMRRWDADYRRAYERIRGGAIGRPVLFKSLQFDAEVPAPGATLFDPAVSGGILVDMGIHEFDLARWLVGDEVREVHAFGTALLADSVAHGDHDTVVINLRFAGGALGSVELSRPIAYGEDVRTEVVGPDGTVFVGLLPLTAGALGTRGQVAVDVLPGSIPRFERALVAQAQAFARAVLDGQPVAVGGKESHAALAIALAARASLRDGQAGGVPPAR